MIRKIRGMIFDEADLPGSASALANGGNFDRWQRRPPEPRACPSRARSDGHIRVLTVTHVTNTLLHDDLGRVHRVKAKPLRSRSASPDTAATTKAMAATRRTGRTRTPQRSTRRMVDGSQSREPMVSNSPGLIPTAPDFSAGRRLCVRPHPTYVDPLSVPGGQGAQRPAPNPG